MQSVPKKWVVAVEWTHDGNQDCDEVAVTAPTAALARKLARDSWRKVHVPLWPGIKIRRTFIITEKMMAGG